jgi:multiple sugar transport system ATP-binding protein
MGQRTAVLDSGELQPVAPPLELYHRPANRFVAFFVGSPPMNFFEGRIVAGDGILMFRGPSFEDTRPMTAATNGGPAQDRVAGTPVRARGRQFRSARVHRCSPASLPAPQTVQHARTG